MIAALSTFRPGRPVRDRLPVTLVTGFLGSGKTTLVNHLLRTLSGARTAVLVNELGDIAIDNELIVALDDTTIELANGCVCCSTNGDLVEALARVLERSEPVERIVVETTGAADPGPVALTLQRPEFRRLLRLDAIVTVAEADQFSLQRFDGMAARSQLRLADTIVLNKCDLADAPQIAAVEESIAAFNPQARVLRAVRCAVPPALVVDVELFDPATLAASPVGHLQHDGFDSISFGDERPLSGRRFQAFLEGARALGIVRGKGFLYFAETGRAYLFHLVGDRFTLEDDDHEPRRANRLVLIGQNLDAQAVRQALAQCIAEEAAAPGCS